MVGYSKATLGWVMLGMVGGASIAIAAQLGLIAALGMILLPVLVMGLPAFITQGLRHLARLAGEFDVMFVPWVILYLSGLVFRTRDKLTIQDDPVDGWALFRIGLVGMAFLLIFSYHISNKSSVRSLYQGFPGVLTAWALPGVASTAWSAFPSWTLYKSLEYGVDVAAVATIVSRMKAIEDCKRFFDFTWILLFGLLLSVWMGAAIWPNEALERGANLLGIQLLGVVPSVAANGVGELAALLCIICWVRITYSPHKLRYSAVFACCSATLILAQTRSALAAFFGAGLSILIVTKRYISALLIVAAAALWPSSSSAGEFWKYIRRGQDDEQFKNLSGRTEWWAVAMEKIKQQPVLGYGAYSGGRFVVSSDFGATLDMSSVQNDYLEIVLGTGVVGLCIVVVAIAGVGFKVLQALHTPVQSTFERGVMAEAVAAFTVVMIRSMFSTTLFWHPPLPFLLIVGYSEFLRRRSMQDSIAPQDQEHAPVWADSMLQETRP
jgi:O-antigen ligase